MRVLTAHNPRGFLHAVTCIKPGSEYTAERFTAIQQGLGCTVRVYTLDDYLEQQRQLSQTAPKPTLTQAIRSLEWAVTLPGIGQNVVCNVIGWATVTHFVTLAEERVAVAAGPRGAGLLKPGQWRAATEADQPFWMRHSETAPQQVEISTPCTLMEARGLPARRMVSLFEVGA